MSEDSSEQPAFNSVDAYYSIARTLLKNKDYRRALHYCGLALRQDDKHIPSLLLRSLCYMNLCETTEALADVQIVLQSEPKDPRALLLLGEMFYLQGDFEEALQIFHKGRNLRPTIEQFTTGVHKCERAIENSCNDCTINLGPEVDLTEFYTRAFPPKRLGQKTKTTMLRQPRRNEGAEENLEWPNERPKEMQRKLLKGTYSDFTYLEDMFNTEGERMQAYKEGATVQSPQLNDIMQGSKENRKAAVACGTYLDKHADLMLKQDPGFRNSKNDI